MRNNLYNVEDLIDTSRVLRVKNRALDLVEKNIEYFNVSFPGDSTLDGIYPKFEENRTWTTGFWTGILALSYEFSGDRIYKDAFEEIFPSFIDRLENSNRLQTHDLGFIYTLSLIPHTRLFGGKLEVMKDLIERVAKSLEVRFKKPGFIQAWKGIDDPIERGRVIIDSMMNLPILYISWTTTGNEVYKDLAIKHAKTCMNYLVREDGSTYHTYFFDPETGKPLKPATVQGYSDNSYWSRGQSWAMYGFALSYAHTGYEEFLKTAIKTTDFFLSRLSGDLIPIWDMTFDENSGEEKDSSAASIAVCALLEISKYVDRQRSLEYTVAALNILNSLIDFYFNWFGEKGEPLILHGVHAKPLGRGVDEGTIWGDYFFLEALMRVLNPRWRPYWMGG